MATNDFRPGNRASQSERGADRAQPRKNAEAPIQSLVLGTRGSALALAQANAVLAECRAAFPDLGFDLRVFKTTGDTLQTASMAQAEQTPVKGLFTKELEQALLNHEADLAVHSLKDLPTELPEGLKLGSVGRRADVRDVLVYREVDSVQQQHGPAEGAPLDWKPGQAERRGLKPLARLCDLPSGATVATSSTRRRAQVLALRPDLKVVAIRGNVGTRLEKLADQAELDATILAAAGLARLGIQILPNGRLRGANVPPGLCGSSLEPEEMLPCVGQGAVAIEVRADDKRVEPVCVRLNHFNTLQCVAAERAFLAEMGGGCQSPVAAYAQVVGHQIWMRAVSFKQGPPRRAEGRRLVREAEALGRQLAGELK
jgi:porphobilinogen deaminase